MNDDFRNRWRYFIAESWRLTLKYFKAKLLISLLMAVIAAVAFAVLSLPLYGLLGLVVGFSNLIPVFGPWLGALATCLIVVFFKPVFVLYVLLVVIILQVLDQFLFSPLILGRSLELKPLVIIVVVLVAGACFNFWGLLFAVPLAACIKLGYELFYLKREYDDGRPPHHYS